MPEPLKVWPRTARRTSMSWASQPEQFAISITSTAFSFPKTRCKRSSRMAYAITRVWSIGADKIAIATDKKSSRVNSYHVGAPSKLACSSRCKSGPVRRSGRLVVSVAWWKVTTTAKRTQRLCGVGY